MSVLLFASSRMDAKPWVSAFQRAMPELEIRVWPDVGKHEEIDYLAVWKPNAEVFSGLKNMKIIFSLGAGLDHLTKTNVVLPENIPLVRMVDPALTEGMVEYAVYMTLRFHRYMPEYEKQQAQKNWIQNHPQVQTGKRKLGVMGLGVIGSAIAEQLSLFGFEVLGWSRTAKSLPKVTSYSGSQQFSEFLARSEILINVLPLTSDTENLLNSNTLASLPEGASVINIGRGPTVNEQDLLHALDSGHLSYAALDVFAEEPLSKSHPFWTHPKITLTPHVASATNPDTAVLSVIENIHRYESRQTLKHEVDSGRGY